MNRREALQSAAVLALAVAATSASAADDQTHKHDHAAMLKYQPLLNAMGDCITKGEVCLAHCLVLLGDGDKSMAECSKSVNQMLAICNALQKLAAQQSKRTPALVKIALETCTECEKECRKHEKKHAECKACAESCAESIKQCKAFVA
ncbi:MAG: four-helix bundle copper-binding protein [Betaproteobacteria bacterium]|nr:four-helix bundle copper-binding protein [Betaproteobacteria bacterium]